MNIEKIIKWSIFIIVVVLIGIWMEKHQAEITKILNGLFQKVAAK